MRYVVYQAVDIIMTPERLICIPPDGFPKSYPGKKHPPFLRENPLLPGASLENLLAL